MSSLKAEALSILPARHYCQSRPWIWSCSVAGSLLMFSVWYLDPIPISKGSPPGALTFWSAWRLSRPPACGISCQWEQTTPLLQNIHSPSSSSPFRCFIAFHCTPHTPSFFREAARGPTVLTGSGAAFCSQMFWPLVGVMLNMFSISLKVVAGPFCIYDLGEATVSTWRRHNRDYMKRCPF